MVISLVFIILITIVIVGFVTTTSLERKTVQSHYAKVQADLYNSMAVGVAASRIKEATVDGGWWVSQPGRIARGLATTNSSTVQFIELSSGTAALPVTEDLSVNLNPASLTSGTGLIAADSGQAMPVKWVYVREDGSQVFNSASVPTYDPAGSPIVGRYAFWADDQSCRLNLNVAASSLAPAVESGSHPAHLGLASLATFTGSDLSALRTFRQSALFESPQEAKAAADSATLRSGLDDQKLDLTHYSHSPDRNLFGDSKIVLTTKAERAGTAPFFDILSAPGLDPGVNANIDATKFNTLFNTLYAYLSRKDWPLNPGKSFVDKYGPENTAQIVLNLIDYVRSAEAEKVIVEASRGSFSSGVFSWAGSVATTSGIMGNARRMLITQMGVWVSDTAPWVCKFRTEVYLPLSVGDSTTEVNLLDGDRYMLNEVACPEFNGSASQAGDFRKISSYGSIEGGTGAMAQRAKMKPGQFRTITMTFTASSGTARPAGPVYLRSTIRIAGNPNVGADIAPLWQSTGTGQARYQIDPPGLTVNQITSLAINDPVINKSRADWTNQGANTFGASTSFRASTLGQLPGSVVPQQDTSSTGVLSDAGFGFPAVKGSSKNPLGMVQSLGELGQIHTGGKGALLAGVPWRTLRFQPRLATDQSLPDWALLDLFAVPGDARGILQESEIDTDLERRNAAVFQPVPSSIGGLINVNARLHPFSELSQPVKRTTPLVAALRNDLSSIASAEATAAADSIVVGELAAGSNAGRAFGPSEFQDARMYFTPGQLSEIKNVADSGEASEARLRTMLPYLTSRSSVFSVFSVGQKITQLRNGQIRVLGESRSQSLLERRNGSVSVLSTTELGL